MTDHLRYRVRRPDGTLTGPLTKAKAREVERRIFDRLDDGQSFAVRAVEIDPPPAPPDTATKSVGKIWRAVFDKFPELESWGVFNCRKIDGSSTWSQHAWGNALDLHGTPDEMKAVANFLVRQGKSGKLPVAKVIYAGRVWTPTTGWRSADVGHFDHPHVEGKPVRTGTPPCA